MACHQKLDVFQTTGCGLLGVFKGHFKAPTLHAQALHGLSISAAKHPGVIMDVSFDANGDLDRESFLVEVKNARQVVVATLPALGKK